MDPGTHMVCARFYPLEPGVTIMGIGVTITRDIVEIGVGTWGR
jgi:hypothetical protein